MSAARTFGVIWDRSQRRRARRMVGRSARAARMTQIMALVGIPIRKSKIWSKSLMAPDTSPARQWARQTTVRAWECKGDLAFDNAASKRRQEGGSSLKDLRSVITSIGDGIAG